MLLLDLIIVFRRDPTCQEAKRELDVIMAETNGLNEDEYGGSDMDESSEDLGDPYPNAPPLFVEPETPMLSETSDFEHEGNNVPCRSYNHDGCKYGSTCKFKHGPDDHSIRDNLWVCIPSYGSRVFIIGI